MGGDPFVVAMYLQEVINHKKLDRILRREAKSRIDAFNVNKDPDGIKGIRPKYLEGEALNNRMTNLITHHPSSQPRLLNSIAVNN